MQWYIHEWGGIAVCSKHIYFTDTLAGVQASGFAEISRSSSGSAVVTLLHSHPCVVRPRTRIQLTQVGVCVRHSGVVAHTLVCASDECFG